MADMESKPANGVLKPSPTHREYDIVRLKKPIDGSSIEIGTTGTVLMVLCDPVPAYEVEFVADGKFLGTFTVAEDQIEK